MTIRQIAKEAQERTYDISGMSAHVLIDGKLRKITNLRPGKLKGRKIAVFETDSEFQETPDKED